MLFAFGFVSVASFGFVASWLSASGPLFLCCCVVLCLNVVLFVRCVFCSLDICVTAVLFCCVVFLFSRERL